MSELTKVILDGPMGKQFGRTWNLAVESPGEALRLIEANRPGLSAWIKANLAKYSRYKVICEYEDGRKEDLDNETYALNRKAKTIRFVPLVEGASGVGRIVAGIILIVVAYFFPPAAPYAMQLYAAGASMILGGIAQLLAPKPSKADISETEMKSSHYFDGPVNTTQQGVPVPLIYGTCLVGSHAVSASITIDQLM